MTDADEQNPYASPTAASLEVGIETSEDWQVRQLRAFVGRNADYYLRHWAPLLTPPGGKIGFNWAALLFSGPWLLYRKMYKIAAIFLGVVVLETVLELVLFRGILRLPDVPAGLDTIIGLATAGVCGGFGNRWYFSHARHGLALARSRGLEGETLLSELAARGGTSLLSALGLFFVFMAVMIGVTIVVELILAAALAPLP